MTLGDSVGSPEAGATVAAVRRAGGGVLGREPLAAARVAVNRYPDGEAEGVKAALRATLALPAGAGIIVGNGSDELLQIITSTLARPGASG